MHHAFITRADRTHIVWQVENGAPSCDLPAFADVAMSSAGADPFREQVSSRVTFRQPARGRRTGTHDRLWAMVNGW
jgi:hypothetical protein